MVDQDSDEQERDAAIEAEFLAGDVSQVPPEDLPELSDQQPILLTVEARAHGWRLDHYLARIFSNYSRELFKKAIEQQRVLLNGLPVKASRRMRMNDQLSVRLPEQADSSLPAEDIPLEVLYEDSHLIVINKQAGLLVHPGKGNYRGTLAGALQFHFDQLSDMAGTLRPGIVHRLDRDTSGVMVIAKNNQVHHRLSGQFERREVRKEYRALVYGDVPFNEGTISTHLRLHPRVREKMQVCQPEEKSRDAVTRYEVLERFAGFSWVRLLPRTGRTHQLRVHMLHLEHPIVADKLYAGRDHLTCSDVLRAAESAADAAAVRSSRRPPIRITDDIGVTENEILIHRQALHAMRLEFQHPESGKPMAFEAPLPADMQAALAAVREFKS